MLYGGIEAGGTKIVCAVGMGPADLRDQIHFPTTAPGETLAFTVMPGRLYFFDTATGKRLRP